MAEIVDIRQERIDDVPLIIGVGQRLGLEKTLDRHLGTHGLQQGLNNGQLALGWLGYIVSRADHRKSAVQEWAQDNACSLAKLLGQPLREVEFNDDRLGGVLRRLSDDRSWEAIEQELWRETVTVYELGVSGVRLDSTTSYGYHEPQEEGVMQHGGHSQDHRPDLAQLKLMAAAAEPSGHLIASDVVAGQRADDPLYVPLIRRVREILGRTGLVYAGDSKMAALATRGHLVAHQDYYIVPLPMTGTTGQEFASWVEPIVAGSQTATLIWDGGRLVGAGYEFERTQEVSLEGQCISWTERVQVVRSPDLAKRQAQGLEKRLETAQTKLKALTPEPGRGKRQIRTESALQKAIDGVLEEHEVQGLLTVDWRREIEEHRRYVGPGRPGSQRAFETEGSVRYVITAVLPNEAAVAARKQRLGWRAYATNVPAHQLSLAETVLHYRGGWCLERDFHLVKDLPLGLSPLFVWTDDQVKGLVRLLTLALRLLTLIESQVRRELAQAGASLAGLYEGQPRRATQRPSGKRLLKAFARANLTLTRVSLTSGIEWHITPLSPLHEQILSYLRLPMSLYTHLANP